MRKKIYIPVICVMFLFSFIWNCRAALGSAVGENAAVPWWVIPLVLFASCFVIGIIAVLGGVGGGVLFVPLVGAFFPFHLDYVRGTGLMVAMCGALAASPKLLRSGMVNLRLAMPLALIASSSSIVGALIGLSMPANLLQIFLGIAILGIAAVMVLAKNSDFPKAGKMSALASALNINGIYHDPALGKDVEWSVHRTPLGFVLFLGIGFVAGMFGLGAGWANVPVLNLVMGVPLKAAAASSGFVIAVSSNSAAWIYLNNGAILPMITIPSLLGIFLGAQVGVKLLNKTKSSHIRMIIIAVLLLSGLRALLKGFGI
jgi:uncharacterized membrane protein YfcA